MDGVITNLCDPQKYAKTIDDIGYSGNLAMENFIFVTKPCLLVRLDPDSLPMPLFNLMMTLNVVLETQLPGDKIQLILELTQKEKEKILQTTGDVIKYWLSYRNTKAVENIKEEFKEIDVLLINN